MPATSDFAIAPANLVPCLSDLLGRLLTAEDIRTELIAGGFSNLTYLVHAGGDQLILRRPPLGMLAAGSHDMGREHRILVGLATTQVPAPAPLGYIPDSAALGAPFLLMERVAGLIVRSREDAGALGVVGA